MSNQSSMAWHENNPSALIDLAEDLSSSCHSDNPQEETVNIHSYGMFISLSLSFILIMYRATPSCPCTICVSTGCTLDELTLCLSIKVTKTKSWFFSYWVIGMGIKTPSIKIPYIHVSDLTYKLSLSLTSLPLFLTALSNVHSPVTCVTQCC